MSKSQLLVGNVTILDRGDGPAQEVLDRNARAIAQRVADETREELNKVMSRVRNSLELFETSSKLDFGDSSHGSIEYANDLAELEELLNDQMKRKKYHQQLTVFIVGYQNKSGQRLRLLQQIGEFFTDTINRWEADEATPKSPDLDLEETDKNIHESLQTANELAGRLGEINKEMMDYMYSYATSKAGNKNRKKLEKSLIQAKEDMTLMTERVSTMQKEIEEKDEKIQQLFKQVEMKAMETQRLKAAAEVTKRSAQDTSAMNTSLDSKDQAIKELQKRIEALELDLKQKEASREQAQKELLMSGRESVIKVKELEEKLQTSQLERMQEKRALQEFGEKQLTTLANVHRQEMTEMKVKYESEIGRLKLVEKQDGDVKALQYQIGEHKRQVEVLKQQLEQAEASKKRAVEDATRAAKEQSDAALAAVAAATVTASSVTPSADDRAASSNKDEAEESQGSKTKAAPTAQAKNGTSRKLGKPDNKSTKSQRSKEGAEVSEEADKMADELTDVEGRKVSKPQQSAPSDPPAIDYESSFFDEGVWSSLHSEHIPEVFLKYRNKAVEKVKHLESEIEDVSAKASKKVETLKAQFHEHKERWQQERDSFVEQIELAQKMRREAELEADAALNKLEDFISEQESLERDEEKNALARQQALVQREATPAVEAVTAASASAAAPASSAPAEAVSLDRTEGVDARSSDTASAKQETHMPTDDAKAASQVPTPRSRSTSQPPPPDMQVAGANESKPTGSSMLQLPPAGAASKPASPLTVDAATSPTASMVSAVKVTEHVLDDLRQLMLEEHLDLVQQSTLSEFRSAIEFSKQQQQQLGLGSPSPRAVPAASDAEDDKRLRTLTVFGLASKLSSESYHLGYEPESLLQALISLYANSGKLFYSWKSGMSAVVMASGVGGIAMAAPAASVKSPRNASMSMGSVQGDEMAAERPESNLDLESITAEIGETESVQAEPMSSKESVHSHSPLDVAESLKSESLGPQQTISGRSSPESQVSVHNKYRSVLEEARASLEERRRSRSSATSRVSVPSKASFHDAELDEDGDMPFPEDANADITDSMRARSPAGRVSMHNKSTNVSRRSYYDRTTSFSLRATSVMSYSPSPSIISKEDAATSPKKSPPLSSHPIVVEYLKVYAMVHNFKEAMAKALQDKEMMSASQVLSEIEPLNLDEANPVTAQVEEMTKNVGKVLDDTSTVVDSALTSLAGKEYRVSSLLSVDRRSGTAGSFYSTRQNSADFLPSSAKMQQPMKTPAPIVLAGTPIEVVALKELQQRFEILQKEYIEHRQRHEIEVQHNTVMLMEMQDHVAELQRRLSESGRTVTSAPAVHRKDRAESGHNSPVMFTRLDAERNTKNLKRAALNNRVDPMRLSDALAKMEAYISIPEQRFGEIVKKYVHLMNMRKIAKTIRDSQNLTRAELVLLTRIDALQNDKHKHWLRRMSALGYERMRLAAELTEFLEALEMESGIFLIKPIFSYQGFQTEDPYYVHEKFASHALRGHVAGAPGMGIYTREFQMDPLNTPTTSGMLSNRAAEWAPDHRHHKNPSWQPASAWDLPANGGGSGITGVISPLASTGLPSLGYSWSVSSSLVKDHVGKASVHVLDTPRILEMDINRMVYGQNQVSAKIPIGHTGSGQTAGERASSYLRSYVTVSRPVKPSTAVKPTERPFSGESVGRLSPESKQLPPADGASVSRPGKGRSSPLPPILKAQGQQNTSSSGNTLMAREYSEDAITPNRLMKLIESSRSEVSTPAEDDEYDDIADD